MPRFVLIHLEHGEDGNVKPYGLRKIPNMKFSFIISMGLFLLGFATADSRILNNLKYLEYLNDIDRQNLELDEIHNQWPFNSISRDSDQNEDEDERREKLMEIVNLARAGMATNNFNIRDRIMESLEEGFKNFHEPERADQLSQYRRYNTMNQDNPEPYPGEKIMHEASFAEETPFIHPVEIEEEDQELRPSIHRPFFPRIAPVEKPLNYQNTFTESEEESLPAEEEEEIVTNHRPSFPKAYFPRIAPVDIPVNYKIDDESNEHHDHHDEEYKFAPNEEFPQTINFDTVPLASSPDEFAMKPTDPRFLTEEMKTVAPPKQDTLFNSVMKSSHVSKPKMNSRSDLQNPFQSLPEDDSPLENYANKDVKVVPFNPDAQADSTGMYIIAIVAGISAAATVGLLAVGIGWYNLHKHLKNSENSDYPSYGIVGPNKDYDKKDRNDVGDRRLAQSAQMYHYQHQKQQIIAMGRHTHGHGSQSESEEEEDEEGNYTVYECPGLASIEGPLEVKNPMFDDEQLINITPCETPSKMNHSK